MLAVGHDLAAHVDLGFAIGRRPDRLDGLFDRLDRAAEIGVVEVRGDADDAGEIVAFVGADRGVSVRLTRFPRRTGSRTSTGSGVAQVLERLGALLGDLHLEC